MSAWHYSRFGTLATCSDRHVLSFHFILAVSMHFLMNSVHPGMSKQRLCSLVHVTSRWWCFLENSSYLTREHLSFFLLITHAIHLLLKMMCLCSFYFALKMYIYIFRLAFFAIAELDIFIILVIATCEFIAVLCSFIYPTISSLQHAVGLVIFSSFHFKNFLIDWQFVFLKNKSTYVWQKKRIILLCDMECNTLGRVEFYTALQPQ